MFQSLKSHEPEFVSELVRLNKKVPPPKPSTYHIDDNNPSNTKKVNLLHH